MKAFLLSAGFGTRLQPLTNSIPKCLIPINGFPLLEYWCRLFRKYEISNILINTHHLHNKIYEYITNNIKDLTIRIEYEQKLLGSMGCILTNKDYYINEESFFVFYSDNITNLNLNSIQEFHFSHNLPITIGLFRSTKPDECGIVEIDNNDTIINFTEKPINPKSNLANAGIYIIDSKIISVFEGSDESDIAVNLLSNMIGKMKGFIIKEFIMDIGTHSSYNFANKYVSKHKDEFE